MKKRTVLVLVSTLCFLLACCGKKPTPTPAPPTQTPTPAPPTQTPTEAPTPTPDFSYKADTDTRFQTIDGFGAGYTWYSEEATGHPYAETIYDLLFRDAGLTILRFKNEFGYSTFEQSAASNLAFYEAAKKRAAERGEEVTILYTSWSPAAYLKSNGTIKGHGSLRRDDSGQYDYEGFADWWVQSVNAYREKGIPVDLVSIQNECDFAVDYDGCEFDQRESAENASYASAFLSSYRKFKETFGAEAPLMIAPETMTAKAMTVKLYLSEILSAEPDSIYAVAHHLYDGGTSTDTPDDCQYDSFSSNLRALKEYGETYGFRLWQTEFYRGTALQTANMIQNTLAIENAGAYIYWGGVWIGTLADNLESNTLIPCSVRIAELDGRTGYTVTGAYYAMRHFSEFIRPGYVRVQSSASQLSDAASVSLKHSTYLSPDGNRLVIVFLNNSADPQTVCVSGTGFNKAGLIRQSVFSQGFTADMMYQDKGAVPASGYIALPAESVTTVVLDR